MAAAFAVANWRSVTVPLSRAAYKRTLCSRRKPAYANHNNPHSQHSPKFQIVSHKPIFQRYQTVFQRDVRFPSGRTVSYDVLGNQNSDYKSVFVFPFNSHTNRVTLLREYAPGRNEETVSFVAGMYEASKHVDVHAAARAELSEEARLKAGKLLTLANRVAADKYSMNEYFFFLALDYEPDQSPSERDDDEWISEVFDVRLNVVRDMITGGELNTPNSLLGMLALDKLRHMGFPRS